MLVIRPDKVVLLGSSVPLSLKLKPRTELENFTAITSFDQDDYDPSLTLQLRD